MRTRLAAPVLVTALLSAACSGGDDDVDAGAPEPSRSQAATTPSPSATASATSSATSSASAEPSELAPADAPANWTRTELGPVTVATPPGWRRQATTTPAPNLQSTTWRAAEVDGASRAGITVRVITSPQQPARQAALALSISAMAQLGARDVDPEEVSWPGADEGYYLAYTSQVVPAPGAARQPYETRTLVLDLDDDTQVQVTSLVAEAAGGAALAEQAVTAVEVTG